MFCTCHERAFGLEKFHLYCASQSSFEEILFHFHKAYSLNVNYSILFYIILYNNQINARALIGQSAVGYYIVTINPVKNRASSELLYKSNRPQVSMVY